MKFDQDKLDELIICIETDNVREWQYGKKPKPFAEAVLKELDLPDLKTQVELNKLPNEKVKRCDVFEFVKCEDTNALTKILIVLAWGGMRLEHATMALRSYQDYWKKIVNDMLNENLSSVKAYEKFHCLVNSGEPKKLKGMGPAYFTKLIYFLQPKHDGYIMDQWTARSMNLLRKGNYCEIHLIPGNRRKDDKGLRSFYVDPKKNDASTYEDFCEDLECLANRLGMTTTDLEVAIFSNGGALDRMGRWRYFVLKETS